ncbi:MAG TPA: hypothetical protein VLZ78_12485 [Terrimesophilobacter sp.]|nr:hypothetical protein [Terrimesophilobacter sp.]
MAFGHGIPCRAVRHWRGHATETNEPESLDTWPTDSPPPVPERARALVSVPLGVVALGLAALFVVGDVLAISMASSGNWRLGTVLAQAMMVATLGSLVLAVVAAALGRGRRWAVAAAVLSVLANPLVLTGILSFADPL